MFELICFRIGFHSISGNVVCAVRSTHDECAAFKYLRIFKTYSKPLEKLFAQKLKMLATHVEKHLVINSAPPSQGSTFKTFSDFPRASMKSFALIFGKLRYRINQFN